MEFALIFSYSLLSFLIISTTILAFLWRKYYVIYNHRLLFVIGLVFSRSLTNFAVIEVLMWYFTYYKGDLVTSAILSNLQESLSSLLVIFMAHAADSFVGRFRTLLFSTTAYISGLMLLWMFTPYDVQWLLVVALVLLAFGTSGANLLEEVLIDLVNDVDKSQDRNEERSRARAAIWSRIAYVSGAISVTLWVSTDAVGGINPSWRSSFMICIVTMTASLMIFCKGHNVYFQGELTERPVEIFFRVFRAKIHKLLKPNDSRYLTSTSTQDRSTPDLESETRENEGSLHLDTTGKRYGGSSSYKQDILLVKSLLRMFPMWGMYLVISLISATGSTFFLEQYSNLNTSNKIPIQIYNLLQDFSSFAILYLWSCGNHWTYGKNEKVKIGVGMLFAILSCVFAWQLEVHRLKGVNDLVYEDENTTISFLWLVPQFCVLGCMEGLTREGLLNFFKSQIKDEPVTSCGEEYIEIVLGLGKLVNIIFIRIFKSKGGWFSYTINESRLDKYYRLLAVVCSANFIIYCCIAKYYYRDVEEHKDLANNDSQQDHLSDP